MSETFEQIEANVRAKIDELNTVVLAAQEQGIRISMEIPVIGGHPGRTEVRLTYIDHARPLSAA